MQISNSSYAILYCKKKNETSQTKSFLKISSCLKESSIDYNLQEASDLKDISLKVNSFIDEGYKTIIIIGGDLQLSQAVNALMLKEENIRKEISLGIIPYGKRNDFANYWGIEENEIEKAISFIKNHRIRKVDVGCLSYKNEKQENKKRYFLNCVNIGLISAIQNLRRQTRRVLGLGSLSFLASMILVIFQRMDYLMKIKINSSLISKKVMTMCIGSATGYGLTPHAVPYNGMLDVSIVLQTEMTQLLECIYLFWTGKLLNHRKVRPYRTREVIIEDSSKAFVSVDGEIIPTPVGEYLVTIDKEAINFIIPD